MKSTLRTALAVAALLTSAVVASAQSTPGRTLLALSKHDHTLAMVNPTTLKVIARAPVGPDPHEVIASSDGKTAYVSIYGGGRFHALSVIDLVSHTALPDIDTGALNGPHGLTFVGGELWFTAEGAKAIARLDPATQKVEWIMGTGQNRTHMLFVTPDQKSIYTTNASSASVSILEQVTLPPLGPPPGAKPPAGMMPPRLNPAAARLAWTGTRPSSRSVEATRASTSHPMAENCGQLLHANLLNPPPRPLQYAQAVPRGHSDEAFFLPGN